MTTLLHSAGLSEADIEIKEIGFSAPEVFCLGAVDAAVVYANNEPLQVRSLAAAGECGTHEDVAVLSIADQVDLVSNGLIVSSEHMRTAPEEIARMVRAISQALRMTIDNPAAAYLDSQPYVDTLPASDALIAALEDEARRQSDLLMESPSRAAIAESRKRQLRAARRIIQRRRIAAIPGAAEVDRDVGCRAARSQRPGCLAGHARYPGAYGYAGR